MKTKAYNLIFMVSLLSACFYLEPDLSETKIIDPDEKKTFAVLPHKDENSVFIIKYERKCDLNYRLRLDFYREKHKGPYKTEFIGVSEGLIDSERRRHYDENRGSGKVLVTYLPGEHPTKEEISIFTTIE